jgi:hypothetical protein
VVSVLTVVGKVQNPDRHGGSEVDLTSSDRTGWGSPRDGALSSVPFPSVARGSLAPLVISCESVWEKEYCFEEVPAELLRFKDWHLVYGKPCVHSENILRTEARALERAVRHKYRRHDCLNHRHVFFVDNLPLALSRAKGRADSGHFKHVCKLLRAYQIASASFVDVRWIPSELNPADLRVAARDGPAPATGEGSRASKTAKEGLCRKGGQGCSTPRA